MFGTACYRRNPHHFRHYSHPHLLRLARRRDAPTDADLTDFDAPPNVVREQLDIVRRLHKTSSNDSKIAPKKSAIESKLDVGRPLSFFLTKVEDSPATHAAADSVYFADLLHPSLGAIRRSLQINFMVEWDWLWMNYEVTKNQVLSQ